MEWNPSLGSCDAYLGKWINGSYLAQCEKLVFGKWTFN